WPFEAGGDFTLVQHSRSLTRPTAVALIHWTNYDLFVLWGDGCLWGRHRAFTLTRRQAVFYLWQMPCELPNTLQRTVIPEFDPAARAVPKTHGAVSVNQPVERLCQAAWHPDRKRPALSDDEAADLVAGALGQMAAIFGAYGCLFIDFATLLGAGEPTDGESTESLCLWTAWIGTDHRRCSIRRDGGEYRDEAIEAFRLVVAGGVDASTDWASPPFDLSSETGFGGFLDFALEERLTTTLADDLSELRPPTLISTVLRAVVPIYRAAAENAGELSRRRAAEDAAAARAPAGAATDAAALPSSSVRDAATLTPASPPKGEAAKYRRYSPRQRRNAREAFLRGDSVAEIAEREGASRTTVDGWVKDLKSTRSTARDVHKSGLYEDDAERSEVGGRRRKPDDD
ncbi:MAG: transposase, partial [Planctomycetia bacterium]